MTKPQKFLNFKFDSNFVITLKNTIIVNKVSMHLFKKNVQVKVCVCQQRIRKCFIILNETKRRRK